MKASIHRQAGCLPYRLVGGKIRVLLVTSRDTRRWVIPKGNIDSGLTAAQAAAKEAYEEGGVRGDITSTLPLGFYTYHKRLSNGRNQAMTVEVYPLLVTSRLKKWPEKAERELMWTSVIKAARSVDEPGLARLFLRLLEIERPGPDEADDERPVGTGPESQPAA